MKNPIKMEFKKEKTMIKNGIEISGFWTFKLTLDNYLVNNHYLDFVYKYSILNEESNINVLERLEKRKIRILLNDKYTEKDKDQYSSSLLLKNSKIEIIDVNFVAHLDFDQIGDKKIFVGTYLQTEKDFETISKKGINTVLNIQTDKDLEFRNIDINLSNKYANKYGITIKRFPLEDFNKNELYNKLKDAANLLNQLILKGNTVYVHCTAGIGRAPSVVAIYLILFENYSVREAVMLCKKSRPKISLDFGIMDKITKFYNAYSEL